MIEAPLSLSITLDREGEEPIYRQLIRSIKMQIESGSLSSGTRLPASRELAQQLEISRISVVNAYAELRAEGYLSAHAGRGTFVSKESPTQAHTPSDERMHFIPNRIEDSPDRSLREMMRLARQPGIINFGQGAPPVDFLPTAYLREAINAVLDRDGGAALSYERAEGYAPLRHAVRDYVSALGIQCNASDVLITGGTQQAIDLVIQSLLSEGETLITEEPTYIGVLDIARARRVRVQGIPIDDEGLRLDYLENYLIDHPSKLIYVMPSFQNPTATVMPLHRRRQLLNIAQDYNLTVLEDGVYHEFRFEGEPTPPLKALDESGVVIHASGFTKMLLPGIRIGYLIATSQHYSRLVRVKQAADISTPGLNQRAIHYMLEHGIMAQQLERNNREFRRRREAALQSARKYFPAGTRFRVPQGGIYLWVRLPTSGPTAAELYIPSIQNGVAYAIGNVFFPNNPDNYYIRLNYGANRPDQIDEGFRRLGDTWRDMASRYVEMEKSHLL